MVDPSLQDDSLLKVCSLLNKHGARYLIAGAHACILHGLVRTTEDVDILIEEDCDNYLRIIAALSELEDHAASELQPKDFEENVVVKIADEVEVDVSRKAWKIGFLDAFPHRRMVEIKGVAIPFLGLDDLIKSKETYRAQDQADLAKLLMIRGGQGR